jgi:ADP-ribosylglycohydrolase
LSRDPGRGQWTVGVGALDLRDLLVNELAQRREAGYEVADLEGAVAAAVRSGGRARLEELLGLLERTPRRDDWPYDEPAGLDQILARLPEAPPPQPSLDKVRLHDRLLGAWLGRCAGCQLGKPVEGWTYRQLRHYLELAGAYPLGAYVPALQPMPEGFELRRCWPEATQGHIRCMARDDDIDFTILGLHILETHGFGFQTRDVAAEWLDHLPFTQTYTAERVALRNLIDGLLPPDTAGYRNPYREWIGARIRADIFGYVSPGDPRRAAILAFRDATLSHTANGVFGAMWSAALTAACFLTVDVRAALAVSLEHVPPGSRLAEALGDVLEWHAAGLTWDAARMRIQARYGHYSWIHTVNNAAVVAAALLWGAGDYSRTIGLAVQAGGDTDSNGATAGSVIGALHGAMALPSAWIEPLHDRVRSAVAGFDNSRISELAERTLRLAVATGTSANASGDGRCEMPTGTGAIHVASGRGSVPQSPRPRRHGPIGPIPVWTAVHGSRRLRRGRTRGRGGGERWPVG